jgi:hypothetical protein
VEGSGQPVCNGRRATLSPSTTPTVPSVLPEPVVVVINVAVSVCAHVRYVELSPAGVAQAAASGKGPQRCLCVTAVPAPTPAAPTMSFGGTAAAGAAAAAAATAVVAAATTGPARPGVTAAPHDVREGLRRLARALTRVRYPTRLSLAGAAAGDPAVLLPMLQYLLAGYSRHVSAAFSSPAYRFATHALDARFCDNALRAVNAVFGLRGRLTAAQFMEPGFGEHKLVFVAEVATRCAAVHDAAEAAERRGALRVLPHVPPPVDTPTLLRKRYSTSVMRPASAAPPGRMPPSGMYQLGASTGRAAGAMSPAKVRPCPSAAFALCCVCYLQRGPAPLFLLPLPLPLPLPQPLPPAPALAPTSACTSVFASLSLSLRFCLCVSMCLYLYGLPPRCGGTAT